MLVSLAFSFLQGDADHITGNGLSWCIPVGQETAGLSVWTRCGGTGFMYRLPEVNNKLNKQSLVSQMTIVDISLHLTAYVVVSIDLF